MLIQKAEEANVGAETKTIIGPYLYIENPSTTKPVLPGMAYAVLADETYYFITIKGHWFSENKSWDNYTPEPGDLIEITGYLHENKDVFGKTFYTIEALSLKKAK